MRRLAPLLCLCLAALASGAAAQTADELPKDCAKVETQRQLTACAYRDFEHRGEHFRALVKALDA